jgi:DNA segregation ATPase FtsK/SpoIIIE, S-DNA-T family
MASADPSLDVVTFIADYLRDIAHRRLQELAGLALFAFALMGTIALATWSVDDPSFSHATHEPIKNLLGYPGAIFSDLAMQLFGLASVFLVAPEVLLGWRLLRHQTQGGKWRDLMWIIVTLAAAACAATWPVIGSWPLPTGLGGVIGDTLLRRSEVLISTQLNPALTQILLSLIYGVATLVTLKIATGWRLQRAAIIKENEEDEEEVAQEEECHEEEKDHDLSSAWLGMVVHALLSWKARFSRWAGNNRHHVRVLATTSGDLRQEPRFDSPNRVDSPAVVALNGEDQEEDDKDEDTECSRLPHRRAGKKGPERRSGNGAYTLPSLNLLSVPRAYERTSMPKDIIDANAAALEGVLQDFGVRGEIVNARTGPVVTLYELAPAPGIKSSRVIGLADDIARSMSALSARVAVVPGRNAIGIELPNPTREKVYFRELLSTKDYNENAAKLPLCLGKTIGGEAVITDLVRMPHLLIAGTTGSGKSVAINTMILSLVYRLTPDQCRLIMVDPKMLELSVYDGIPHLLTPVVTDPKKAIVALKWAVREMESRYKKMSKLGVRNIDGYNARVMEAKEKNETLMRTVHTGYDKETGEAIYEKEELELDPLPYIVVIVDEMADLMMVAGKDIEGAIQRLAQMARAAGIHVIVATQRPSVDVITGTIKANFPTRISFQVTSKIDSRTILGEQGAEQLLGQGDMLYMAGGGRISRVHGPFVSDDEVEKVVRHLKSQGQPEYLEEVTSDEEAEEDGDGAVFDQTNMGLSEGGDLYQQAVAIVKRDRKASTSYIQRRLQIGYNRAATIMERMEEEGIVGQANHAGKREILVAEEGEGHF